MRSGKAQSTLEFVTANLGIFMLILLLTIFLLYIGIANADLRQERCDMESLFTCNKFGVSESGGLSMQVGQMTTSAVLVKSVSCSDSSSTGLHFTTLNNQVSIPHGEYRFIAGENSGNRVDCIGARRGEMFVGRICIIYTKSDTQLDHTVCGSIMAKTG